MSSPPSSTPPVMQVISTVILSAVALADAVIVARTIFFQKKALNWVTFPFVASPLFFLAAVVISITQNWLYSNSALTSTYIILNVFYSFFYWPAVTCQIQLTFFRLSRVLIPAGEEKSGLNTRINVAWYSSQIFLVLVWIFTVSNGVIQCLGLGSPSFAVVYNKVILLADIFLVLADNTMNILLVRACLNNNSMADPSRNISRASAAARAGGTAPIIETKFDKRQHLRKRLLTLCIMVVISDLLAITVYFGNSIFLGENATPIDATCLQSIGIALANCHVLFCLWILRLLLVQRRATKSSPQKKAGRMLLAIIKAPVSSIRDPHNVEKDKRKAGDDSNFPECTELSSVKPMSVAAGVVGREGATAHGDQQLAAVGEDSSGFVGE